MGFHIIKELSNLKSTTDIRDMEKDAFENSKIRRNISESLTNSKKVRYCDGFLELQSICSNEKYFQKMKTKNYGYSWVLFIKVRILQWRSPVVFRSLRSDLLWFSTLKAIYQEFHKKIYSKILNKITTNTRNN